MKTKQQLREEYGIEQDAPDAVLLEAITTAYGTIQDTYLKKCEALNRIEDEWEMSKQALREVNTDLMNFYGVEGERFYVD